MSAPAAVLWMFTFFGHILRGLESQPLDEVLDYWNEMKERGENP